MIFPLKMPSCVCSLPVVMMSSRLTTMDGSMSLSAGRQPIATNEKPEKDQRHKQYWSVQSEKSMEGNSVAGQSTWMRVGTKSRISYSELMILDQVGLTVIAEDKNSYGRLLAIKRINPEVITTKKKITEISGIPMVQNDFVVNIIDCFWDRHDLVVISEQMDVSLRHINGVVPDRLEAFEIAAICKDVRPTILDATLLTTIRY